jgi:RND superfamily putative drug exporter
LKVFVRLGRVVVAHPWRVIGVWIVAAVVIVSTAPPLPTSTEQSDFLPRHYESIKADDLRQEAFPSAFTPSVILVARPEGGGRLSAADSAKLDDVAASLKAARIRNVERVVVGPPAPNRLVQTAGVQMPELTPANQEELFDSVKELRAEVKPLAADAGLTIRTAGSVAQGYDQQEASGDADAIVAVGTVALIIVLLLAIFRSPVVALMPIVVIGIVSLVASGLIADVVEAFGLEADSSITALLTVVLFGIGTDYILFLLFRYRERLRMGEDRKLAMISAVSRVGEAITSAAGVVIIAFMAMTLSSLGFLKSMGPSLAIAVTVTLLAGLTLVPAVVSLLGPRVFWPSKSWRREPEAARFARLGRSMARHPARFAIVSGLFMLVLALGALSYNPTFDLASGSLPDTAESQLALRDLEKGLPPGATQPTDVYLRSDRGQPLETASLTAFGDRLEAVDGVGQVAQPELTQDRTAAAFSVTLASSPESDAALELVAGPLRDSARQAAPEGTTALVGGITSVFVDIKAAMNRDYSIVFPVAALLIMLVLGLLLRSLVAPVYLMASVALGFVATLGATTLLFQDVQGESGLIFMLPLIMYMFVVALGTDYNILMTARLREEAREGLAPREALNMATKQTGPTIAAAGVILAGSFAILLLAGNSLLSQMGFAIAFGILVAAFAMATFLTPALTALLGHAAWWPGHQDEPDRPVNDEPDHVSDEPRRPAGRTQPIGETQ